MTKARDPILTVSEAIHFGRRGKGGRKEIVAGPTPQVPHGRVPRLARLMALALRFDAMVRQGSVADYAELARLGHVTRARMTQIMSLLNLAPSIQEAILHLPPTITGRDPLVLRDVLSIASQLDWRKQRQLWRELEAKKKPELALKGGNRHCAGWA
jgi:hypothetical protein